MLQIGNSAIGICGVIKLPSQKVMKNLMKLPEIYSSKLPGRRRNGRFDKRIIGERESKYQNFSVFNLQDPRAGLPKLETVVEAYQDNRVDL